MAPELNDAIKQLAMQDAVVRAALMACRSSGLNQEDTLAHVVLRLASSKRALEQELFKKAAHAPPDLARFQLNVDSALPPGTIEFRNPDGSVAGRIVNVGKKGGA